MFDIHLSKTLNSYGFQFFHDCDLENGYPAPRADQLFPALNNVEFDLHCYPHGYVVERDGFDDMRICKTVEEALIRLWIEVNKESIHKQRYHDVGKNNEHI